jgi:hypothetical protein
MKILSFFSRIFRSRKTLDPAQLIDQINALKKTLAHLDSMISKLKDDREFYTSIQKTVGYSFSTEITKCTKHLKKFARQKAKILKLIARAEVVKEIRGNVVSESIGIL